MAARWPGEPYPKKPPAGRGQPVLYLDFDGVLHHEDVYWHPKRGVYLDSQLKAQGHRLFEYVPVVEELLQPHPSIKIVLSTSWFARTGSAARP